MIKRLVKPVNLMLAGYSFMKSSASGRPVAHGMPLALGAELTNHCNLSCPECATGSGLMKRARGFMDTGLFNRVISELRPYLFNINLYFQGEPLMHPEFSSFIRSSRGCRTVISTNGHYLSEENCDKIARSGLTSLIVSMDGIDQSAYSSYRVNGCLDTVLGGLKNMAEAVKRHRSSLKIEIQVLVNSFNENQIPQIRKLAAAMNFSLRLKSMQVSSKDNIGYWMPSDKKFRRYEMSNGAFEIRSSLPGRCARLWFNPVITWDGKVVPCCFDKNGDHVMGDLNNESFREIWNGSKYRLFRKLLLSDRSAIEICRNCTSGLHAVKY
jgi:radical SAM protein with 4Fe4S-binding SPASM domain